MTTDQGETTETTGENGVTSSSSHDDASLYFESFVVIIGIIGIAANGLVVYALVASKQHKKQELIFHQNVLDLYSCVFLVITDGLLLFKIPLSGSLGYWLCMFLFSGCLLSCGVSASWINLMFISIERYLKVVHPVWSKKKLRKWMTYAAMACAWIGGIINEVATALQTSAVIDGVCYGYTVGTGKCGLHCEDAKFIVGTWEYIVGTAESRLGAGIFYFSFTYVFVLVVFTFCYGKILMVIRRQSRVMAGHNPGGSDDHNEGRSAGHNTSGSEGHNDGGLDGHKHHE